jgi:O-succinylbenzoate synthase
MRIDSIDIFRVNMKLVEPFRTACGDDFDNEAVLVRMSSDGVSGWGEAAPGRTPTYAHECGASLFLIARDFIAPELIGQDIPSGADLHDRLSHIRGNRFAKAAFDIAWWDLQAKIKGLPLWKLIGGRRREIEAGADFGVMDTHDELIAKIDGAVARGYRRVKLKCRPGWDIDMVAAVRERFPHTTFHVDCNSAYTPEETELFQEMDRFNLAMIEQPLAYDDLIDHAILQERIETPICLDESIDSASKARKAVMAGSCRWINIKPGRVGGITPALVVHDICREAGIGCWVGGMLESSVGAHVCLALATLSNILYPSDVFPSSRFYARDLGTPAMEHSAPGKFTAPDIPGCGAEPDPAMLERLTLEMVSVKT